MISDIEAGFKISNIKGDNGNYSSATNADYQSNCCIKLSAAENEKLLQQLIAATIKTDPSKEMEKILRGLRKSFEKTRGAFQVSLELHALLVDACQNVEAKPSDACLVLKLLFDEFKLHRVETADDGSTATDCNEIDKKMKTQKLKENFTLNNNKVFEDDNDLRLWEELDEVSRFGCVNVSRILMNSLLDSHQTSRDQSS